MRSKTLIVVDCDQEVRLREPREQAILDHCLGAGTCLLGGLANEYQRSAPPFLGPCQQRRCADPRRHVNIVPASMHHPDRFARGVLCSGGARVRKARLLSYRQRI
jgi:hypothetical protein